MSLAPTMTPIILPEPIVATQHPIDMAPKRVDYSMPTIAMGMITASDVPCALC